MQRLAFAISSFASMLAVACSSSTRDASCEAVGKHLGEVGKDGDRGLSAFRTDRERAQLVRDYTDECVKKKYSSSVRRCLLKTSTPADIVKCTAANGSPQPTSSSLDVRLGWHVPADGVSLLSLATSSRGETAVAGIASNKASLGGTPIATTSDAPFVALIGAKGNIDWQRTLKFPASSVSVSVANDGTVWMSGATLKPANELGPEVRALAKTNGSSRTGFLIAWSTSGEVLHQYSLPGAPLGPIAIAPDGDVLVTSTVEGKIDVGGGSKDCGGSGILLARLHADGSHVWSTCASTPWDFKPTAEQASRVRAVALHETEMLACGEFSTALSLGTTIRPSMFSPDTTPQPDILIASINATDGKPRLLKAQGGPSQEWCRSISSTPNGIVIGAAAGNELLGGEHGDYSYVEPTILHLDSAGKRDWGWVDERRRGAARAVTTLRDGRVVAIADDDDGASLVLLDRGQLIARTTLHGADAVLEHERLRIQDVAGADGIVILAVQAVEARDGGRSVPGQSFVAQLLVRTP